MPGVVERADSDDGRQVCQPDQRPGANRVPAREPLPATRGVSSVEGEVVQHRCVRNGMCDLVRAFAEYFGPESLRNETKRRAAGGDRWPVLPYGADLAV
jgi:hypothetical protein